MAYTQNNSQGRNDRVRFDLMERIGVLSKKDNGWTREVNIVAWNDGPGKVDIREWDPDHKRMTKGVTLFEEEAETLTKILARRYGLTHSERSFGELTASPKGRTYIEPAGGSADEAAEPPAGSEYILSSDEAVSSPKDLPELVRPYLLASTFVSASASSSNRVTPLVILL